MIKWWETVKFFAVTAKYELRGGKNYLQAESIKQSNVMKQRKTWFKYQPNF